MVDVPHCEMPSNSLQTPVFSLHIAVLEQQSAFDLHTGVDLPFDVHDRVTAGVTDCWTDGCAVGLGPGIGILVGSGVRKPVGTRVGYFVGGTVVGAREREAFFV
eukprot:1376424-Amorphochlora_amoeboformis.AAC.1